METPYTPDLDDAEQYMVTRIQALQVSVVFHEEDPKNGVLVGIDAGHPEWVARERLYTWLRGAYACITALQTLARKLQGMQTGEESADA